MKKFRRLLIAVAIGCLLYGLPSILLHFAIKPTYYQALLGKIISTYAKQPLKISTDVAWSAFPEPDVQFNQLVIENTQNKAVVITAKKVQLQLKWLPLFVGKIKVKKIILSEAHIHGDQLYSTPTETKPTKQNTPFSKLATANSHHSFALTASPLPILSIQNSSIDWTRPDNHTPIEITHINLMLNSHHPQEISIIGNAMVTSQATELTINLSTLCNIHHERITLPSIYIKLKQMDPRKTNQFSLKGSVDINLATHQFALPHYSATINNLALTGTTTGDWSTTNHILVINFKKQLQLGQGMIDETGSYTLGENQSSITDTVKITQLDLGPMLALFYNSNSVQGQLNLTGTFNTTLQKGVWLNALNGTGNFLLQNTTLGKLNANAYLTQANIQPSLHAHHKNITLFSTITGTFSVKNGVFYNNDLVMTAHHLYVTGSGAIQLPMHTLNYKIYLQKNKKSEFKLPLTISGDLARPNIQVNLRDSAKTIFQEFLNEPKFKLKSLF